MSNLGGVDSLVCDTDSRRCLEAHNVCGIGRERLDRLVHNFRW